MLVDMPNFHHKNKDRGVASIIVTFMFLLVISLIVVAYGRIIRREQQQSLDRQLSTAAFYAAESGINVTVKYLGDPATNSALRTALSNKSSCNPISDPTDPTTFDYELILDQATNNKVKC